MNHQSTIQPTIQPTRLTKADVVSYLKISERTLERLVKARRFPPPARLGKSHYWEDVAVFKWIGEKFENQRKWVPKPRRRYANTSVSMPA